MDLPRVAASADLARRARAALAGRPLGVVGGVAAAAWWQAWDGEVPVVDVHVGRRGGRPRAGVRWRHEYLRDDEVVEHDGLRTTSPARTAYDVLRWIPAPDAVAVSDRLAERYGIVAADMCGLTARHAGAPGNQAVRDNAGMTDPRSRTPGVSRVRVALTRSGLRPPEVRPCVGVPGGVVLPDLGWSGDRVAVLVGDERVGGSRDALLLRWGGWTVAPVEEPAAGDRDALDRVVRTVRRARVEVRRRLLVPSSARDDLGQWEVEEWDGEDARPRGWS